MSTGTLDRRPLRAAPGVPTMLLITCNGKRRTPLPPAAVPSLRSFPPTSNLAGAATNEIIDDQRWLRDLEHVADDALDDAIADVLDRMDRLLESGQLDRCAAILKLANPERLAIEVSLSLLSGTLPARKELFDARTSFCNLFEARLKREMPDDVDALLGGLRP